MRFLISLLTLSGILLAGALPGNATPIKVDLKRLLDQAEKAEPFHYTPARVGWNGPEKPPVIAATVLPPQDVEVRRWLWRLAIPDPRILVAFGFTIFGIRLLRRLRE